MNAMQLELINRYVDHNFLNFNKNMKIYIFHKIEYKLNFKKKKMSKNEILIIKNRHYLKCHKNSFSFSLQALNPISLCFDDS